VDIVAVIDSRVWLPPDLPRDLERGLKSALTHANPDFHRKRAMGFATWGIQSQVKTFDFRTDPLGERMTIPLGAVGHLREVANDLGHRVRWMDRRTTAPVEFPSFCVDPDDESKKLRWYQLEAVEAALRRQVGIIRAPTGSGKSIAGLAFIQQAGERAVIIVQDGNLAKQWRRVAARCLDMTEREIGMVGAGKWKPGDRLTIALQQTLYKNADELTAMLTAEPFGCVLVDEVQGLAARTFVEVADRFPCKYRIGVSADETRKDKKEFLIYDVMGRVLYEIGRDTLETERVIHPVTVRVIPTEFRADWYASAPAEERDFNRLLDEMIVDDDRNALILDTVEAVVESDETPALLFSRRREHAHELADRELSSLRGIRCGLLMGGTGADQERFQGDLAALLDGRLKVAAGTFNAIGVGHDLPAIRSGIIATPISSGNRQFFGQVRGRVCRSSPGKDDAFMYYLWDQYVFPNQIKRLQAWNDGLVEVRDARGQWVRAR
jgi:superfamily II DNA or RNA helicase